MTTDLLFVYGSLRKSLTPARSVLVDHCLYLGFGVMQGLLYEVDGYPGAVESSHANHHVLGELYKMANTRQVLSSLDVYEECTDNFPSPHEYLRKKLTIATPNNTPVQAWVYVYNRAVTSLRQIRSGDYLNNEVDVY